MNVTALNFMAMNLVGGRGNEYTRGKDSRQKMKKKTQTVVAGSILKEKQAEAESFE